MRSLLFTADASSSITAATARTVTFPNQCPYPVYLPEASSAGVNPSSSPYTKKQRLV
ncbi:hypothetical protein IMZ48_30980 [Candidatus Bathyarchaeota archaeon]|nr:hypothetical protein [Candidatus Bathyarchaeota archaeon]